jgi:quinoprotein glucose dehydrogenase
MKRWLGFSAVVIFISVFILLSARERRGAGSERRPSADSAADVTWPVYGGDESGRRFSSLTDVNSRNVQQLTEAWEFSQGDFSDGSNGQAAYENEKSKKTSFQVTPLFIENKLIYCTPFNRVIALDPGSGKKIWSYDDALYKGKSAYTKACRGVSYWRDDHAGEQFCSSRILVGTMGAKLIALDTATGRPCPDFGVQGLVDLKDGLGKVDDGDYYLTSPPAVYKDLAIVGGLVVDNQTTEPPSGVIRAFNIRTGKLVWAWDPVPPDYDDLSKWKTQDPAAYGKYVRGSPNSWSLMSVDLERGVVFAPIGNPGADYFKGRIKPGIDALGSSVVALNAETGRPIWDFKIVRRDVWDYDMPAQPVLFTQISPDGRRTPALAQATKLGHVFLLDRSSGKPLFGVREIAAPKDSDSGEDLSPTQIEPVLPKPLHPYRFSLSDLGMLQRMACQSRFNELRFDGVFTPPTLKGSLQFPSPIGGINWGSVSIDEENQILVTNLSVQGLEIKLVPRAEFDQGGSNFNGVLGHESMEGTPYGIKREPFAGAMSLPCVPSPWGKIVAIDLKTGQVLWEKPLGSAYGYDGLPNMGGSLITAGGLIFIGAAIDSKFRAFDIRDGRELWSQALKYGGQATPMTYRYQGKQYVVIADGGHGGLNTKIGDRIVAFTLK